MIFSLLVPPGLAIAEFAIYAQLSLQDFPISGSEFSSLFSVFVHFFPHPCFVMKWTQFDFKMLVLIEFLLNLHKAITQQCPSLHKYAKVTNTTLFSWKFLAKITDFLQLCDKAMRREVQKQHSPLSLFAKATVKQFWFLWADLPQDYNANCCHSKYSLSNIYIRLFVLLNNWTITFRLLFEFSRQY